MNNVKKQKIYTNRVKLIREHSGIKTKTKFAGLLCMDVDLLGKIEKNEILLPIEIAYKIVKKYGSDLDWLYMKSDTPFKEIKEKRSYDCAAFNKKDIANRVKELRLGGYVKSDLKIITIEQGNEERLSNIPEFSQKEFAKKIDVKVRDIEEIEQGNKILSEEIALKIVDCFDISLDWLYELSDDPINPIKTKKVKEYIARLGMNIKYTPCDSE